MENHPSQNRKWNSHISKNAPAYQKMFYSIGPRLAAILPISSQVAAPSPQQPAATTTPSAATSNAWRLKYTHRDIWGGVGLESIDVY